MIENPLVSIIVLTYYHEKYISDALESIFLQEVDFNYEIIVADDFSQDKTRSIVDSFAEKFPELIIKCYNGKNLGISQNLYNGLVKCRGKYITLLAGDDCWLGKDSLRKKIDFLEKNDKYFALCTQIEIRNQSDGTLISVTPKKKYVDKELTMKMYLSGVPFHTHGFVMRNILTTEAGKNYFSTIPKCSKYIDDSTICLLVLKYGSVYCLGITAYKYNYQTTNTKSKSFNASNTLFMKAEKEIQLYNNFHKLFPEIDLLKPYSRCLAKAFGGAFLSKDLKAYKKLKKSIPKIYRRRGVAILSFPIVIKKMLKRVLKK